MALKPLNRPNQPTTGYDGSGITAGTPYNQPRSMLAGDVMGVGQNYMQLPAAGGQPQAGGGYDGSGITAGTPYAQPRSASAGNAMGIGQNYAQLPTAGGQSLVGGGHLPPAGGGYDGSGINPQANQAGGLGRPPGSVIPLPNGPMPTVPPGGVASTPVPAPPPVGGGGAPQQNQPQQGSLTLPGINGQQFVAQAYGTNQTSPSIPGAAWQPGALPTNPWNNLPAPQGETWQGTSAPRAESWQNTQAPGTRPWSPIAGGANESWQNMTSPGAQEAWNNLQGVQTGTSGQVSSVGGGAGGSVRDPTQSGQQVQTYLNDLLNSGNPYITNAARRGLETAGSRGLLNSSIAAGASTRSAIEAAQPILNEIMGLNNAREGMQFQGGESAAQRNLQANLQAQDLNFTGGQNDQNRALQSAMQALGLNFEGQQGAANRNLQQSMQTAGFNFEGGQNAANRNMQQNMQNAGFNFEGGQNAENRNLQQQMQNAGFNFEGGQNAAQRSLQSYMQEQGFGFEGGQNAANRNLQQNMQNQGFNFEGQQNALQRNMTATLQQQGWGFEAAQAEAQRQVQVMMDREGRAFQGEQSQLDRTQGVNNALLNSELNLQSMGAQNYYSQQNAQQDYDFRRAMQSDSVTQQDWLSSQSFSREFNAGISMLPIQNASQLHNAMMQAALNDPETYTPEVLSGFSNFFNNQFLAQMQMYFPSTSGGTP